jgi:nucleolar protein 4
MAKTTSSEHTAAVSAHEDSIAKRCTLFVRSLDYSVTSAQLSEKFSFVAPIKHATVVINPSNKESRGFGFVTFADAEDAQRALKELDGAEFQGRKMKVELAVPRQRKEKETTTSTGRENTAALPDKKAALPQKKDIPGKPKSLEEEGKRRSPRLIIRNLPWSIQKPEQLLNYFQPFGKVKDIIIPKKRNGEMSGFAFVTMKGYKNAERAIEKTNGIEIEGRPVAVDWAIEKNEWEKVKAAEPAPEAVQEVEKDDEDEDEDENENENEDEEMGEDDDEEEDEEDEEMDEDEDEEMDDEDEDEDDEDRPPTDSTTTLFIRNLPYSATDDSVYQHFTQFGPVHYARIVMDHATDRPKGTGFVCFYSPEIALEVLRDAPKLSNTDNKPSLLQAESLDPDGKYTLDGRILSLSRAVERNEADKLASTSAARREKTSADKRRLFLLNEGMIPASSAAWKALSPSERLLRDQSREQRRKLVQADPNLHLSLTRLSIRNLPRWVTHKDLKQIARKAIPGFAEDMKAGKRAPLSKEELARDGGEGKAAEEARRTKGLGVVKQAKVQLEKTGGRSRGYGFVEYWSHRYALMGLRFMNGQLIPGSPPADEEGAPPRKRTGGQEVEKKKRLIVEFAIENAKVVHRRKENEIRSKEIGEKRKADAKAGIKPGDKNAKGKGGGKQGGGKQGGGKQGGGKRKRDDDEGGKDMRELKKRKNWNQKSEKKGDKQGEKPGQKKQQQQQQAAKTPEKTQEIIRQKRIMRKKKGGK